MRVVSLEEQQQGAAAVAKCLAEEASLNRDQLGFVAMIAVTLQSACVGDFLYLPQRAEFCPKMKPCCDAC